MDQDWGEAASLWRKAAAQGSPRQTLLCPSSNAFRTLGLADIARHVVQSVSYPCLWNETSSYDVASDTRLAPLQGIADALTKCVNNSEKINAHARQSTQGCY